MVHMADENAKLTDCYYEKKDWRACKDEVCDKILHHGGNKGIAYKKGLTDGEVQGVLENTRER